MCASFALYTNKHVLAPGWCKVNDNKWQQYNWNEKMTQLNERTLNRLLTVKFANIGALLTLQNVLYTYMINAK